MAIKMTTQTSTEESFYSGPRCTVVWCNFFFIHLTLYYLTDCNNTYWFNNSSLLGLGGEIKPLYPIKYRIQSFIKNHDVFRNIRKEKINTEHKRRQYVSLRAQTRTLMFQRWAIYPVENFLPKRWWCLHGITLKEIPFYGGKSEL